MKRWLYVFHKFPCTLDDKAKAVAMRSDRSNKLCSRRIKMSILLLGITSWCICCMMHFWCRRTVLFLRVFSDAMSNDATPYYQAMYRSPVICLLSRFIPTLQSSLSTCICSMSELWTLPLSRCQANGAPIYSWRHFFLKNSFSFIWRIGSLVYFENASCRCRYFCLGHNSDTSFKNVRIPWERHIQLRRSLIVLRNPTNMHPILDVSLQNNKLTHNSMQSGLNNFRCSSSLIFIRAKQTEWTHMKRCHD